MLDYSGSTVCHIMPMFLGFMERDCWGQQKEGRSEAFSFTGDCRVCIVRRGPHNAGTVRTAFLRCVAPCLTCTLVLAALRDGVNFIFILSV